MGHRQYSLCARMHACVFRMSASRFCFKCKIAHRPAASCFSRMMWKIKEQRRVEQSFFFFHYSCVCWKERKKETQSLECRIYPEILYSFISTFVCSSNQITPPLKIQSWPMRGEKTKPGHNYLKLKENVCVYTCKQSVLSLMFWLFVITLPFCLQYVWTEK